MVLTPQSKRSMARVSQEFKRYLLIVLYLWIFLGSFTIYRRLVIAESGGIYLNYGIALVEALIVGKVIAIGRLFSFSRRYEEMPLIVPVLFKTVFFGLLVLACGAVQHVVEAWFHDEGLAGVLSALGQLWTYEVGARVLMLMIALVPFFAFLEMCRVLKLENPEALFFAKREAPGESEAPTT